MKMKRNLSLGAVVSPTPAITFKAGLVYKRS